MDNNDADAPLIALDVKPEDNADEVNDAVPDADVNVEEHNEEHVNADEVNAEEHNEEHVNADEVNAEEHNEEHVNADEVNANVNADVNANMEEVMQIQLPNNANVNAAPDAEGINPAVDVKPDVTRLTALLSTDHCQNKGLFTKLGREFYERWITNYNNICDEEFDKVIELIEKLDASIDGIHQSIDNNDYNGYFHIYEGIYALQENATKLTNEINMNVLCLDESGDYMNFRHLLNHVEDYKKCYIVTEGIPMEIVNEKKQLFAQLIQYLTVTSNEQTERFKEPLNQLKEMIDNIDDLIKNAHDRMTVLRNLNDEKSDQNIQFFKNLDQAIRSLKSKYDMSKDRYEKMKNEVDKQIPSVAKGKKQKGIPNDQVKIKMTPRYITLINEYELINSSIKNICNQYNLPVTSNGFNDLNELDDIKGDNMNEYKHPIDPNLFLTKVLKDKYNKLIDTIKNDLIKYEVAHEDQLKDIDKWTDQMLSKDEQVAQLNAMIDAQKNEIGVQKQMLTDLQARLDEVIKESNQKITNINIDKKKQIQQLKKYLSEKNDSLTKKNEELNNERNNLKKVNANLKEIRQKLEEMTNEHANKLKEIGDEKTKLNETINNLQKDLYKAENVNTSNTTKIKRLEYDRTNPGFNRRLKPGKINFDTVSRKPLFNQEIIAVRILDDSVNFQATHRKVGGIITKTNVLTNEEIDECYKNGFKLVLIKTGYIYHVYIDDRECPHDKFKLNIDRLSDYIMDAYGPEIIITSDILSRANHLKLIQRLSTYGALKHTIISGGMFVEKPFEKQSSEERKATNQLMEVLESIKNDKSPIMWLYGNSDDYRFVNGKKIDNTSGIWPRYSKVKIVYGSNITLNIVHDIENPDKFYGVTTMGNYNYLFIGHNDKYNTLDGKVLGNEIDEFMQNNKVYVDYSDVYRLPQGVTSGYPIQTIGNYNFYVDGNREGGYKMTLYKDFKQFSVNNWNFAYDKQRPFAVLSNEPAETCAKVINNVEDLTHYSDDFVIASEIKKMSDLAYQFIISTNSRRIHTNDRTDIKQWKVYGGDISKIWIFIAISILVIAIIVIVIVTVVRKQNKSTNGLGLS